MLSGAPQDKGHGILGRYLTAITQDSGGLKDRRVRVEVTRLLGFIGYFTSRAGVFVLVPHLASRIPESSHTAFLVAGWAHGASYLAGFDGGIILWIVTWRRRAKLAPH